MHASDFWTWWFPVGWPESILMMALLRIRLGEVTFVRRKPVWSASAKRLICPEVRQLDLNIPLILLRCDSCFMPKDMQNSLQGMIMNSMAPGSSIDSSTHKTLGFFNKTLLDKKMHTKQSSAALDTAHI